MAEYSDQDFDNFVTLSAALTGYSRSDLVGTGVVPQYCDLVFAIAGNKICGRLLSLFEKIDKKYQGSGEKFNNAISAKILHDPALGPLARNIIKMWYLANWDQMPFSWREKYGAHPRDVSHVVSSHAYTEGLVWRTIGTHAPGAKQPGFGTWKLEPQIEPFPAGTQKGPE